MPIKQQVEVWKRLRESADRLNAASDGLNEMVLRVEESLAEMKIGVSSSVEAGGDLRLLYGKTTGSWGISIRIAEEEWRFGRAPRQARILAVRLLPALLECLVLDANTLVGDLDTATLLTKQSADALKGGA